jgi:hypothetical protein
MFRVPGLSLSYVSLLVCCLVKEKRNIYGMQWLWYFQIDEQLASGEYFMSQKKKTTKKWQDKQEKQAQKTAENKRKREAAFIPPEEVFLKLFHSNPFPFY